MKYAASCKTRFIHLYKMSFFKVFPFTVNLGQGAAISPCATSQCVQIDTPFILLSMLMGFVFVGMREKCFWLFQKDGKSLCT